MIIKSLFYKLILNYLNYIQIFYMLYAQKILRYINDLQIQNFKCLEVEFIKKMLYPALNF